MKMRIIIILIGLCGAWATRIRSADIAFPANVIVNEDPECLICLEEFTSQEYADNLVITGCPVNHPFHVHCLQAWEERNAGNPTCPTCRRELGAFRVLAEPLVKPAPTVVKKIMCKKVKKSQSALIRAARGGHLSEVRRLLERDDVDINTETCGGRTALMYAAKEGYIDIVSELLKNDNIDINHVNNQGQTALILALTSGNQDIAEVLAAAGAHSNVPRKPHSKGYLKRQRRLIKKQKEEAGAYGIPVESAAAWAAASTQVRRAAKKGSTQTLHDLLSKAGGAEAIQASKRGDTALMLAAKRGHIGNVQELLGIQATDVNAVDKTGTTALMIAAKKGKFGVVNELLGIDGILVNTANRYGNTALIDAARMGHLGVVRALLQARSIDINHVNFDGHTALSLAEFFHHFDVAEVLRAAGAHDIKMRNARSVPQLINKHKEKRK